MSRATETRISRLEQSFSMNGEPSIRLAAIGNFYNEKYVVMELTEEEAKARYLAMHPHHANRKFEFFTVIYASPESEYYHTHGKGNKSW